MAAPLHPLASHHLPSFITAPGETDVLMVVTAVILAVSILAFGILFFRLHHLPEHMAHGAKRIQLEVVSVLCLIGLLTHIHAFWIAALLLAMVDLPDFSGWLTRIAEAVERIAGPAKTVVGPQMEPSTLHQTNETTAPPLAAEPPPDAKSRAAKPKETIHA
jgi:hypothetical protein